MHNDFLNSAKGRLLAYRKRKKRVIDFWWSGKLQSKKSASPKLNAQFQNELLENMKLYGRKGPFTGALMVDIQFWAAGRNSPEVHSLAKHYLDLLQKPAPGVSLNRSRVLVRDDAQIEFLSCSYDTRMDDDGFRLRVRRLSDFFEDLELYIDIANGNLGSRFEFGNDRHEEMDREYTVDHYLDFRKSKRDYAARFGSETADKMELIWKRDAQEALLASRRLELRSIAALLRPRYDHLRKDALIASILTATSRMARSVYEHPFMSVNFGARAVKQGESKEFRERVRQGLLEAKSRTPLLYPLLAPCGVTVLYLPPRNASKIDLDNLMRESIIPSVHEILQPPGSPREFLGKVNQDEIDPHLAEMLERYKRAPKFHITGYQVFCLPRTTEDPENGNVRLILHGGDAWETPWELLDSALTKWEDSDPED
jgi:hypothetical protein